MLAGTALKALLRERHLQEHRAFCREYDKVARVVDREQVGGYPSKATFYRWLSGSLTGLPHPGHCRILEHMFPGWKAEALFLPWPDEPPTDPTAAPVPPAPVQQPANLTGATAAAGLAGVTAIYTSRTEFSHEIPTPKLFDSASEVAAAGLSLNLICQQYPDLKLRALLRRASVRLLFLDPDGESIQRRNREEGHEEGHLSAWSRGNINIMSRLRDDLGEAADKLELRMYDETIRFNLMFIDQRLCVMQTYLPALRGLDSPTFVMERTGNESSDLYSVYHHIFASLWESGKTI
ncbi:hypothetical protein EV651_103601 [Kribbella sp. VKM Ac-2571]|uniref:DUF5919 domain-containing protein n=1 Tax=Kribbella sp. VKM Ac-2571 TaxID=2512222 RepID=UPI00105B2EDF|nr:DUF5919 domain-containing protein [Kribbella sp. VKM Ac-2571]TDO67687.1 hypothetical protein EV651_103601 [Kribbella sp. VKM Ac-2571]